MIPNVGLVVFVFVVLVFQGTNLPLKSDRLWNDISPLTRRLATNRFPSLSEDGSLIFVFFQSRSNSKLVQRAGWTCGAVKWVIKVILEICSSKWPTGIDRHVRLSFQLNPIDKHHRHFNQRRSKRKPDQIRPSRCFRAKVLFIPFNIDTLDEGLNIHFTFLLDSIPLKIDWSSLSLPGRTSWSFRTSGERHLSMYNALRVSLQKSEYTNAGKRSLCNEISRGLINLHLGK